VKNENKRIRARSSEECKNEKKKKKKKEEGARPQIRELQVRCRYGMRQCKKESAAGCGACPGPRNLWRAKFVVIRAVIRKHTNSVFSCPVCVAAKHATRAL
jgi:hypothetical protein